MACSTCNNETANCSCTHEGITINDICNPVVCETDECSESFAAGCIIYNDADITCNGTVLVTSGDSVAQAMANIAAFFCAQDALAADIICGVDTVVPLGTTVKAAQDLIVTYFCNRLTTIEADITTLQSDVADLQQLPGLAASIAKSTPIANSLTEGTLFGTIVGALQVPANGFAVGDSFLLKGLGNINVGATPVNLTLRVKINGTAVITKVLSMKAATTKNWDIAIMFTIRSLGATGDLAIGGEFSYAEDASDKHIAEHLAAVINTLDTTILNTLDITAQWDVADVTNSIDSEIMILHKIY